jgi:hypothetical protein
MTNFLYILLFKDNKHFKIGISSKDYSRVKSLNNIYEIDLDKSYLVHSKKSNITILERELLAIFDQDDCNKFESDGHTEIRNVKYLDECLNIIRNKHLKLNYELTKFDYNNFINPNKRKKNKASSIERVDFIPEYMLIQYNEMIELLSENVTRISRKTKTNSKWYEYDIEVNSIKDKFSKDLNNKFSDTLKIDLVTEGSGYYRSWGSCLHGIVVTEYDFNETWVKYKLLLVDDEYLSDITYFKYHGKEINANIETVNFLKNINKHFQNLMEVKNEILI